VALRIHHVQIAIPRGGESRADAFYVDLLELRRVEKPAELRHLGGVWFALADEGAQLHLGIEEQFRPARKAHVAILVPDLARTQASLEAARHPIVVESQLDGYRRFYTEDPFGNRLEILAEDTRPVDRA
jgi:catechol 2,3-dioxygenase-like lactoylglutathione lyase family enzyme